MELIDKNANEQERKRQIELKRKEKQLKQLEIDKEKERNKFKQNEDLMINRIIPYAMMKDNWVDKVKQFRFSTVDQKRLYEFNNNLSQVGNQNKLFESLSQSAISPLKKLPVNKHESDRIVRASMFKVKSQTKYNNINKIN